jgi:hypothetical protein
VAYVARKTRKSCPEGSPNPLETGTLAAPYVTTQQVELVHAYGKDDCCENVVMRCEIFRYNSRHRSYQ